MEQKLITFLQIVGHQFSNRDTQERFQNSGETIHRYFHESLTALISLADDYIKLPEGNIQPEIRDNNRFYPEFKNCLGALDGTHITLLKVPFNEQQHYWNRKGRMSQNVFAACNMNLEFLFVLAGWEGSAHDMTVMRSAMSKGFIVPEGKYYLADVLWADRKDLNAIQKHQISLV